MTRTHIATGTASVDAAGTAVTIDGVDLTGIVFAGDLFLDPAQPLVPPQRIASDADSSGFTLALGWPGTAMAAAAFEVRFTPDSVRASERTRQLLEQLSVVQANGRGLFYRFDDGTTDADPSAGKLRFNHATIGSATAAYIDDLDAEGAAVSAVIDTWDDGGSSANRGQLWVRSINEPAVFHAFNVTGSVVDGTGYRKLTLAYIGGSGALAVDDELMVMFSPTGLQATFEEGVWTPTVTFLTPGDLSVTYNPERIGTYLHIGSMVYVNFDVRFTPIYTTASGQFRLSGLPFPVGATGVGGATWSNGVGFTWPAGTSNMVSFGAADGLAVRADGSGVSTVIGTAQLTSNPASTGYHLRGSFWYSVA